jgi:tetratricopeptide (TPR) repeat protein
LAAAIFALHPVMVESVAWITEQKNTLSAVFYLSAMRAYLQFDESRNRWYYTLSLALFVLGLLTKTVTATLPAALLVIFWWRRGRIDWKQDVLPLVPFFALGAIGGIITAYVEYTLIGAQGESFEMSLVERGLLAGRTPWFYLSKLLWPANLIFIYPRWEIDPAQWWQWLFPAATLGVFVSLWALRKWSRAPLAAWLLFVGTLFPALGFLNVYPFLFSFVADHFQYLASISMIVLAAAGLTFALRNVSHTFQYAGVAASILLIAAYGTLTFRQSRMYADSVLLYEATIANNSKCWMAHYNLGNTLLHAGQFERAIHHLREAVSIRPEALDARVNLGVALKDAGRLPEAADVYREAIERFPTAYEPRCNLGGVLAVMGKNAEAMEAYDAALAIRPDDPTTLNLIAVALMQQNRYAEALEYVQRAMQIDPNVVDTHNNLGLVHINSRRISEAIAEFQTSLKINPDDYSAHNNLGLLYASQGDTENATQHFAASVRINPTSAQAHNNLGELLRQTGRAKESVEHYEASIRLLPSFPQPYLNLAQALAVLGRSQEAVATAEKGIEVARAQNEEAAASTIETWLTHYRVELTRETEGENAAGPQ